MRLQLTLCCYCSYGEKKMSNENSEAVKAAQEKLDRDFESFMQRCLDEIRLDKGSAKDAFSSALKIYAKEEAVRKAAEKAAAAELAKQLSTVMASKGISVSDIAAKLGISLE